MPIFSSACYDAFFWDILVAACLFFETAEAEGSSFPRSQKYKYELAEGSPLSGAPPLPLLAALIAVAVVGRPSWSASPTLL